MKNFNAEKIPALFGPLLLCNTMDYYGTGFKIPDPKFGVDYYGNIEGALYNVFRVDAVALHNCGCNMLSEMFVHTPDGRRYRLSFNSGCAETNLDFFEDREDFVEYVLNGNRKGHMPVTTLREYLKDADGCYTIKYGGYQGNTFNIKGFCWRNGMVKEMDAYFDLAWKDKDGLHIVFGNDLYTTGKECLESNFTLVSGEFREDAPKARVYKVPVTLEIVAESEEMAREIAEGKIARLKG